MKILSEKKKVIFSVLFLILTSIALQFVQIKNRSMYLGDDWIFHYNRFYDAAQQIKERNFQYFISMYGFSESGRIVNALYGPFFAYLNGALLLVCKTWYRYQLVTNFLITFFASLSMFTLLKKNKIRIKIALVLSFLYSSLYVVQSWSFNQNLGSWGSVLFPLGILAASKLLEDDYKVKNIPFLVLTMYLCVQIHLLTSLLMIIIMFFFFIIGLIKTNEKKKLFIKVSIAAIITILMTANVWYPLVEVNMGNDILRPFVPENMESSAVKLLSRDSFGYLNLFVFFLFIMQFLLVLFLEVSKKNKIVTLLSFFFFILSSTLLPWNDWATAFPSITIIQFPFRFFLPAVALLFFALGLSSEGFVQKNKLKKKNKLYYNVFLLLLLFLGASSHYQNCMNRLATWNSKYVLASSNSNDVYVTNDDRIIRKSFIEKKSLLTALELVQKTTPDYVPVNDKKIIFDPKFHPYKKYKESIIENPINKQLRKKVKNHKLILSWDSNEKEVQLPVIVYKNTQVILNGKKISQKDIIKDDIGSLLVQTKKRKNTVQIYYRNSFLFYYTFFESIFTTICFIIVWIRSYTKRKKIKKFNEKD